MRFDKSIYDEIRKRTSLTKVLASYGYNVELIRGKPKTLCPFHHYERPTLDVDEANGTYSCFGCGEQGDVIRLVSKLEKIDEDDVVLQLAAEYGIKLGDSIA